MIRNECVVVQQNQSFFIHKKDYTQQFSHVYNLRLNQMKPNLKIEVNNKWGDLKILEKIIDSENDNEATDEYVLIGTIFKQMYQRNSVLDEFKESMNGLNSVALGVTNFSSPVSCLFSSFSFLFFQQDDSLVLEDDSGRINLLGITPEQISSMFVTGVVVALKGRECTLGEFMVICLF
jgi:hypothetical protein